MKTNKTTFVVLVIIIVIMLGVALFRYLTRPIAAPTMPIENAMEALPAADQQDGTLYRIVPTESKVTFKIGEMLRGTPFTAVGTTDQVIGDLYVSPTGITAGTLKVDARTFKTDDPRRDGAIGRLILKSEDPANEFIVFKPTTITDLSSDGAMTGVPFTVTGDLTISGITKPAIFTVSLKTTGDTLTGTAKTTITRSDFGLVIPNIPFVASVDESFPVSVTIVAKTVR